MIGTHLQQHYRTHTCGALRAEHVGQYVRLAGWMHRKRDHGSVMFVDIRDHYGITQCVIEEKHPLFMQMQNISLESVISVEGNVVARTPHTQNKDLATGDVELCLQSASILSASDSLPFPVNQDAEYPEDVRGKYRFLDLRRDSMHKNIVLRSEIISFLRKIMTERGFLEIQTPILTASSPEGARDYVVPSRLYPGEFYALPQAPQQFKQLLMTAGFDRYFQIAPCFRDEDARADRSPGEFYQLDMEMAFVTQDEIFNVLENVLHDTFVRFAPAGFSVSPAPFPRITYDDAMRMYGSDKPDLRNPLYIEDHTQELQLSIFKPSSPEDSDDFCIRVLHVPEVAHMSRKFFKDLEQWAKEKGAKGLGYIMHDQNGLTGPLIKFCTPEQCDFLKKRIALGGVLFFAADQSKQASEFLGALRIHLGDMLGLIDKKHYAFCWITDFPMYERDTETGSIIFSHNPFSMPQGGMEALLNQDPLSIKAYQYDIVCNGIELSSGAIRNHLPHVMLKAFEIAGYGPDHVKEHFGALWRAFQFGAPPHGGSAPGIDRMVMLLAQAQNIREVIPFPLTQKACDTLMGAPSALPPGRWKELHLQPRS